MTDDEVSVEALQQAVEGLHSCRATFLRTEHVHETFRGETVWEGNVHVFRITGHQNATECFAWSASIPQSKRRQFHAVLRAAAVCSAVDAVRASIAAEWRTIRSGR